MTKTVTMLVIFAIAITLGSVTATVMPYLQTAVAQAPATEPEVTEPVSETEDTTVTGTVPDWFRGVAGFWADEEISTSEFLDGIEFLISEGVIRVPSSGAQGTGQTEIEDVWTAIGALQEQSAQNTDVIQSNENAIAEVESRLETKDTTSDSMGMSDTAIEERLEEIRCRNIGPLADLSNCDLAAIVDPDPHPTMTYSPDPRLSGVDLSGADLSGADLSGLNLHGANLREANLNDANIQNTDLSSVNLQEAKLNDAKLMGVSFHGTNLMDADLHGADLNEAILYDADLNGADLNGASLRLADLESAFLGAADLTGVDLFSARLVNADVYGAIFSDANLQGANFDLAENQPTGKITCKGTPQYAEFECVGTSMTIEKPEIEPELSAPVP